ncbi:MAG TPA: bifunctional glutamate N-acetyltransferase/amino-acid acetyltransferase ArgJ [Negativicutes bacterium]|nr:bifunctional glutamate N-acetyltransferase/amino-acid acetyltransferase ArgJ [Negativicutes bacterium]
MMIEYTAIAGGICAPQGFRAAGVKTGIKSQTKEDVAVIWAACTSAAAGMYTLNKMCAAPVTLTKRHLTDGYARAIVVNSGCANACTGEQGLQDALTMVRETARALDLQPSDIAVASTGVIGTFLPMDKVTAGIRQACENLSPQGHDSTMRAIMTTDTFVKELAVEFVLDGRVARIGGMAKGAGMIEPNMATMLSFMTTDAAIQPALLKKALQAAVERSFHAITIDGDTSTNDTVLVLANGLAGNTLIDKEDKLFDTFSAALEHVCVYLAKLIVRDGEGATKFLEITVQGAADFAGAKLAAKSIANSPLVKTAFFGQDPNWGRIVAAAGYSGAAMEQDKVSLWIGGHKIVENGQGTGFAGEELTKVMAQKDIAVVIDLGAGIASATVWTCDFSYEYVRINGEYTT